MQYNEFTKITFFWIVRVLQKIRNTGTSDATVCDNVVEVVFKQALRQDREIGGLRLVRLYTPRPHDRCVIRRMLLRMTDKITKSQQSLRLELWTRKVRVAAQTLYGTKVCPQFDHLFQEITASRPILYYR